MIDTAAEEKNRKFAPDEDDVPRAHVANDREVILHIRITIEELVSLAKHEDSNRREAHHGERECNSEFRKTGGLSPPAATVEVSCVTAKAFIPVLQNYAIAATRTVARPQDFPVSPKDEVSLPVWRRTPDARRIALTPRQRGGMR
jgi:hypothetical protein